MNPIFITSETWCDGTVYEAIFTTADAAIKAAKKHRLSKHYDGNEITVYEYRHNEAGEYYIHGENLFTIED